MLIKTTKMILRTSLVIFILLLSVNFVFAQEEATEEPAEAAEEVAAPETEEESDALITIGDLSFDLGLYLDLLTCLPVDDSASFGLYMFSISASGEYAGLVGFAATYAVTQPGYAFVDYPTNHWLEEGNIYFMAPEVATLNMKFTIGKQYVPFGLDGDGTWYFTYPYYMGLMLDPDYGFKLSIEGGPYSDIIGFNVDLAYFIAGDNTNGSFNAGLTDTSTEVLGEEKDVFAAKAGINLALGEVFSASVAYSMQMGRYVTKDATVFDSIFGAVNAALIGAANSFFLDHAVELTLDLAFGDFSATILGEFIMYNLDTKDRYGDLIAGSDPLSGMAYTAGVSLSYALPIDFIQSIGVHFAYSGVMRDYGDTDTDSDIMIVGLGLTHYDYFATTLEFIRGKDHGGDFTGAENFILLDFSAGF